MPYTGPGYPNWLVSEYPGFEGVNTALKAFSTLANDPGYGQLTASAASDQPAQAYRDETTSGLPLSAGAGLFGRLAAGNMGADVAGQAAQQQGQTAAQKGRIGAGQAGADLMSGQQSSELALEDAEAKRAEEQFGPAQLFAKLGGSLFGKILAMPTAGPAGTASSPLFGGADLLGATADSAAPSGISDITAAVGGAPAAGGLEDLFATLMESGVPAMAA